MRTCAEEGCDEPTAFDTRLCRVHYGAALDRVKPPANAYSASRAAATALPSKVNLFELMGPVRDQGDRSTCVAFALCAAFEAAYALKSAALTLSPQYLYYVCKETDGAPEGRGTTVAAGSAALQNTGDCLDPSWPYDVHVEGDEGQGPPPAGVDREAAEHRMPGFVTLAPTSVQDIKGELFAKHAVAFAVPVFDSWTLNAQVAATGDITMPIPAEIRSGGHAMCLVGYEDDDPSNTTPSPGGGVFIVRNSWGTTAWGVHNRYDRPGYGTIPYAYIAAYCAEAYAVSDWP